MVHSNFHLITHMNGSNHKKLKTVLFIMGNGKTISGVEEVNKYG